MTTRNQPRALRRLAGSLVGLLVVGLVSACGFDVQTNRPYTPADGVNLNVGSNDQVQIRNLLIISADPGEGILSATIYAAQPDELVVVTGSADALDGDGTPLTATITAPVTVRPQNYVELTEIAPIVVRSKALEAGLTAELTLQFRTAGQATIHVPVMAADISYYESIRPLAP